MNELESRLRDAAPDYRFPPAPRIADGLALPERPTKRPRPFAAVALAAGVAAAATVLGLSTAARSAFVDVVDAVPGVDIRRVEELPPAVPLVEVEEAFGRRVTVTEARSAAAFELRLPAGLPEPDAVYVDRGAGAVAVTALYGTAPGRARLVLTQWHPARLLFRKLLRSPAGATPVAVDGARGLLVFGDDHEVFYAGLDGRDRRAAPYLAGNTLIWQRGRVTYRLEGAVTLTRALELARSLARS